MLRIILGHFSTILIEARFLSQIQSLDTCLVLVIRLALGIPLISVSGAGIDTGCHAHLTCTWVFGDLNSGPDVWVANTLSTEQSL